MTAPELLYRAADLLAERGKQYDQPTGERSMAKAVAALNSVAGTSLDESHGWLLLALIKIVRDQSRTVPHRDSVEDLIAYSALYAESRLAADPLRPVSALNPAPSRP
jgi:hypothetical protein